MREWYLGYRDAEPHYAFVVFSKDRPMQLHALLASYLKAARAKAHVVALHHGSTQDFDDGYQECVHIFAKIPDVSFVRQESISSFRDDLLRILEDLRETRVVFLVDDIVFIRDFDLRDFDAIDLRGTVPSLRLGRNIEYSYMTGRAERLPESLKTEGGFLTWNWSGNDVDWAYPLSVDGNVFLTSEMIPLVKCLEFKTPNSFETSLQGYVDLYENRRGISYPLPRIVNIPSNIVQNDFANRHGGMSTGLLLREWKKGRQIDVEELAGLETNSVHVEHEFRLIQRNG